MHHLKNEKKRKAFGKHFGVPPELRYPIYVQQEDSQHLLNLQKSVSPRVRLYINFPYILGIHLHCHQPNFVTRGEENFGWNRSLSPTKLDNEYARRKFEKGWAKFYFSQTM